MKKITGNLFLLVLALCGAVTISSCWTFAPATEYIPAVDTTYWREQAEPHFLSESQVTELLADGSAWMRLDSGNPWSFYGKTLNGKPVILDITPGTVIHNLRDIFCEYSVSFRTADMPEDVRQVLQVYKTADGITYYEYVVSHSDRIVVWPNIRGAKGLANYRRVRTIKIIPVLT